MLVLQDESHCNEIQLLGIKRHKRHDFWQCRVNRLPLLSVCSLEDWNWSNSIWLIQIKLLLLGGLELWSIVYLVSVRWSLLRFVQSYIRIFIIILANLPFVTEYCNNLFLIRLSLLFFEFSVRQPWRNWYHIKRNERFFFLVHTCELWFISVYCPPTITIYFNAVQIRDRINWTSLLRNSS